MQTAGDSDNRHISRDSLFVLANVRVAGIDGEFRVKVRNLSPGGMMAEGTVRVTRGADLTIEIRNIGWVDGSVAWVQDDRFGIAFRDEIDPKLARAPQVVGAGTPRFVRPPLPVPDRDAPLRKI